MRCCMTFKARSEKARHLPPVPFGHLSTWGGGRGSQLPWEKPTSGPRYERLSWAVAANINGQPWEWAVDIHPSWTFRWLQPSQHSALNCMGNLKWEVPRLALSEFTCHKIMSKINSCYKLLRVGVICYTVMIPGTDSTGVLLRLVKPRLREKTLLFNMMQTSKSLGRMQLTAWSLSLNLHLQGWDPIHKDLPGRQSQGVGFKHWRWWLRSVWVVSCLPHLGFFICNMWIIAPISENNCDCF